MEPTNPYHKTAESYDTKLNLPVIRSFRNAERTLICSILDNVTKPGTTVLDLGCGNGFYTKELAERGASIHAVDASAKMIELVKERLKDYKTVSYTQADATTFTTEPVECVVSIGLVDYLPDWQSFLRLCFSAAKHGVVLSSPAVGLPGWGFKLSALAEGSRITLLSEKQINAFLTKEFPDWKVSITRVGLNDGVTGGLTLIIEGSKK